MELWKVIDEYYGDYEVSNYGRVRSMSRVINQGWNIERTLPEKILKPFKCGPGPKPYAKVKIKGKSISIARLVAKYFIPNPENKPQVNHIDGDKFNNHYSNLEWCTRSENERHAHRTGLKAPRKGAGSHRAKLSEQQREELRRAHIGGRTVKELENDFNVSRYVIIPILKQAGIFRFRLKAN